MRRKIYFVLMCLTLLGFICCVFASCEKENNVAPVIEPEPVYTSHTVEFIVLTPSTPTVVRLGKGGDFNSLINNFYTSFSEQHIVGHTSLQYFYLSVKNSAAPADSMICKILIDGVVMSEVTGTDSIYTDLAW